MVLSIAVFLIQILKDYKFTIGSLAFLMCLQVPGYAAVILPPVLSSNMVLQRDVNVPIWGTAAPGESVTVTFRGQVKSDTADAQGIWKVSLDPLQAGWPTPLEIGVPADLTVTGQTVTGSSSTIRLTNVLVGEVWLGSGQSNMQASPNQVMAPENYPPYSFYDIDPNLRAMVDSHYPNIRLIRLESDAVLRNVLWTSNGLPKRGWQAASSVNLQAFSALLLSFGIPLQEKLNVPVGLLVGAVAQRPSGFFLSQQAFNSDPACQALVDSDTKTPRETGTPFSKTERIGDTYEQIIRPAIPYAIKGVLWDQGESDMGIKGIDQYTLMGALIKGWRKDWRQDFPFIYVQKKGGGGCAFSTTDWITSRGDSLVPLPDYEQNVIEDFNDYLKIRNYENTFMSTSSDLSPPADATSEDLANGRTTHEPGMHPVNKSGYGARAARVAINGVYRLENNVFYGPVYRSHTLSADRKRVIITFDHVGSGLVCKSEGSIQTLQGFSISKTNNLTKPDFVWANARIVSPNQVEVWHDSVSNPVFVRYAWHKKRRWANLFNNDGLPALPFRTYTPPDLSALVPSIGTLTPADGKNKKFDSRITSYTSSVSSDSAGISLTPLSPNDFATTIEVRVNGGVYNNVDSASPSGLLPLSRGANTIDVRVTAKDGSTTRTYTIAVTRRTPYQDWTLASGLSGAGAGLEGDPDGDGLKNILEWAFGTNPTAGSGAPIQVSPEGLPLLRSLIARGTPTVYTSQDSLGGVKHFALFGRRKDAGTVGLTYAVEFSETLTPWTTVRVTDETVIAEDFEIEAVSVPFPTGATNPAKMFFRVRVTGQ